MSIRAIPTASLLLAAALALSPRAMAQTAAPIVGGVVSTGQPVVYVEPASFAENALASCAGGAAIGYLIVVASGAPSPGATAALFCGLSVAATAASTAAVWTWETITWPLRR